MFHLHLIKLCGFTLIGLDAVNIARILDEKGTVLMWSRFRCSEDARILDGKGFLFFP